MRKSVIFLCVMINMYAYTDLGTYGETYEIKEENFKTQLSNQYDKVDKKKLNEQVLNSYKDSFKIKSSFNTCTVTTKREFEPIVKLEQDVTIPFTDENAAKKGEHNILKERNIFFPYNILFIDADDELQVELARYYKAQLQNQIRILVAKGNFSKFSKEPLFKYAKVAREGNEAKAFGLKCLPSLYTQKDFKFIINEYNPKDLLKNEN